ncbi:MAG: ribosomal protein S18-alanine N-acetyltransferase [Acidimicrobiales bacterium]
MRRRHLRGVAAIETQVYARPWSIRAFTDELLMGESRAYLVAQSAGLVVGYCGVVVVGEDGHVTTMAVDPQRHRQGVGTRLMIELVAEARQRGARSLTLEVRARNLGAQALYRRFGFAPVGMRPDYYPDPMEDALIMWVHDVDSSEYSGLLERIRAGLVG